MSRCGKGRWLLAFLLLSAAFIRADAQWKQVPGKTAAMGASCFLSSGATLFAGQLGEGVIQSTDGGATWQVADSGLTNRDVYALTAYGPNLVAGTFGDGLFISSDGGTSWSAVVDALLLGHRHQSSSGGPFAEARPDLSAKTSATQRREVEHRKRRSEKGGDNILVAEA